MEKKDNCGCDMSQVRKIVKLLFTTLLSNGILDCDCMSHNRRSEKKKKKKSGGVGSRHRRSARRAETARRTGYLDKFTGTNIRPGTTDSFHTTTTTT